MNFLFAMALHFKFPILCLFLTVICIPIHSQSTDNDLLKSLLELSSSKYGSDEALVNGTSYQQSNARADGDPFFYSPEWENAKITISNKIFEVQSLKFDIADEKLVLHITMQSGAKIPILLNNEFIENFELHQCYFVPSQAYFIDNEVKGFVDLVYTRSFTFVTKYKKEFVKMYTKVNPNGKFSETQANHYLIRNGVITRIKSKKGIVKAFEPYKKEISKYMKMNHIKFKTADHQQLSLLLKFCDEQSAIK